MAMSFSSRQKYVQDALSCTTTAPFSLAYSDPTQKWIIRDHLSSLLMDFPSLKPAVAAFTYNDGATVNLLTAAGEVRPPPPLPPVSITVWINENYPLSAPMVFVNSGNFSVSDHPFIDSSGEVHSSYLSNWKPSSSNLSELVRNLVKILSISTNQISSSVSRMEAMDRLALSLHVDMKKLGNEFENEIEELTATQSELVRRSDLVSSAIIKLENERDSLKKKVSEMSGEADILMNWLKVYGDRDTTIDVDDVFEGGDRRSVAVMEYQAADLAMEDLIYSLEKAVEKGGVYESFDSYLKEVRNLARTQFVFRAKWMKALHQGVN